MWFSVVVFSFYILHENQDDAGGVYVEWDDDMASYYSRHQYHVTVSDIFCVFLFGTESSVKKYDCLLPEQVFGQKNKFDMGP